MENLLESLKQEIFDLKTKARRKRDSKAEVLRLKNLLNAVEAKRKTFYDASVYRYTKHYLRFTSNFFFFKVDKNCFGKQWQQQIS